MMHDPPIMASKKKDKIKMDPSSFRCLVSAPDKTADYAVDIDAMHSPFYILLRRSVSPCSGEGQHRMLASRA
jgi:hypothetical protein